MIILFDDDGLVARQRHRSEAVRVAPDAPAQFHGAGGHRRQRRPALPRSARGRAHPARHQRHHHGALVVRTRRQHDLQSQNQNPVPLATQRRPDPAAQVLHQKGTIPSSIHPSSSPNLSFFVVSYLLNGLSARHCITASKRPWKELQLEGQVPCRVWNWAESSPFRTCGPVKEDYFKFALKVLDYCLPTAK